MTYYKVPWLLYNTEESYLAPHFLGYNFRSGDRKTLFSDKNMCVYERNEAIKDTGEKKLL